MLRRIRQSVQILVLFLFLYLLVQTTWEYALDAVIPVDFLLRLDPLVGLGTTLASRTVVTKYVVPALGVIILTLLIGRFFCGWICPLGTTLDVFHRLFLRKLKMRVPRVLQNPKWRNLKYYLLAAFGISALLGTQFIWVLDPLAIVTRSYALTLYAYFNWLADSTFNVLYQLPGISAVSEPVYAFLQGRVLALSPPIWRMHLVFFAIFLVIILLEVFYRRFWCRNLCPLGALLGGLARFSLLRRVVSGRCTECGVCQPKCRMGAIEGEGKTYLSQECAQCMSCVYACPEDIHAVTFGPQLPFGERVIPAQLDLSRRSFVKSMLLGAVAVPLLRINYGQRNVNGRVIRPPGARVEEEFLDRCIRCGECAKVCPTNGLQMTFLEAGLEAMWTPILVPKVGYCEYVCVACTKVCPTNAIMELTEEEKKKVKIGTAEINKSTCIPWSEYENCLVCEEACPIPTKAIKFNEVWVRLYNGEVRQLKLPVVLKDKCIGCGICENKCPVRPERAIVVTCRAEGRRTHGGLIYASEVSRMERPGRESSNLGRGMDMGFEQIEK